MTVARSNARRFGNAALIVTLTVATALCAYWARTVPFFAQPDELAHADYIFALRDADRPFVVRDAHPERIVTPEERYLATAVRYRENRYTAWGSLPTGYGTHAYFERTDRAAPNFDSGIPERGSPMPYVMFAYPFGYYALATAFVRAHEILAPHSLSGALFAARAVGVLCLPIMLTLAYSTFLQLRFPRSRAILATIAIGLLPLTSWVFGYVQPDVLTTTLVTAAVYASVRWKRDPGRGRWPVATCAALVALACVKQHYAVATWTASLLAAASLPPSQRSVRTILATFAPPVLAIFCALRFEPVGAIGTPHFAAHAGAASHSILERLGALTGFAVAGMVDAFGGGEAFKDFWSSIGLHGDSIFAGALAAAVPPVLLAGTVVCLMAFVVRQRFVAGRLANVYRRRSKSLALRLVAGDIVINSYVLVTLILIGVYAVSGGTVWLEGRYWLPVIVPMMAIVIGRNGRMLPGRIRGRIATGVAAVWAAYAIVAAPIGLLAIDRAFYHARTGGPTVEPYADILALSPACGNANDDPLVVRSRCGLRVNGYAIDGDTGLPATGIMISIDGKRAAAAITGLPSPQIKDVYNDDALAKSGFAAIVDTSHLRPGPHEIGVAVAEKRARSGYLPAPRRRTVLIEP